MSFNQALEQLRELNPLLAFELQLVETSLPFTPFDSYEEPILHPWPIFDGIEWYKVALENKRGLILESSLEKLRFFLETPEATLLLRSIPIYHRATLPHTISLSELSLISRKHSPLASRVLEELFEKEATKAFIESHEERYFRQFSVNMLSQSILYSADLSSNYRDLPFVVVGRGPSLDISLLKEISPCAVIIGAGAATKELLQNGIRPDFTTALDPQADPFFYTADDLPLFYIGGTNPLILKKKRGALILAGSYALFPMERLFFHTVGLLPDEIDPGFDAATFGIVLALKAQAKSISLMGVDHNRGTLNDLFAKRFLESIPLSPLDKLRVRIDKPSLSLIAPPIRSKALPTSTRFFPFQTLKGKASSKKIPSPLRFVLKLCSLSFF